MPFTSSDLARRIEHAEAGILRAAAAAVKARRPEVTVETRDVAGGAAAFTGHGSPLNKLAGLGFGGEGYAAVPSEPELEAVEAMCFGHGVPVQAEVSSLADPGVVALLSARGYRLVGFENVSGLALDAAALRPPDPEIAITRCDAGQFEEWLDVVVTGFCHPDTEGVARHEEFDRRVLEKIVGDFATVGGMQCYLATRSSPDRPGHPGAAEGAVAAGGGSIRFADGLAQLCGAATLPGQRRRGVQTALLHHRLREAAAAGCDFAVVTTQPGSKSQQNMHRQGFEVLYVRAVLLKDPA